MQLLPLIILGFTLVANLILSIFVLKNNPKGATNRIYFFLAIIVSLWITAMYRDAVPPFSVWIDRLTFFIATPMNVAFFLLAHTLPDNQIKMSKKKFLTLMVIAALTMIIGLTPFAVSSITITGDTHELITGPGMAFFGLLALFLDGGSVYLLFKKFRKSTGKEHEQFRYVMYGILLMFGLIITTIFLPAVLFNNASLIPLAPLYGMIFLAMTAYAIIRHRLLDIRAILARAIAFLFFIFLCAAAYSLVLFVFIQKVLGLQIDLFTAGTALILALVAALSFQPVSGWLRNATNKLFYKNRYDSEKLLSGLTHVMAQTIDLPYMMKTVMNLLVKEMQLSKTAFLIMDKREINETFSQGYKKAEMETKRFKDFFAKNPQLKTNFIFDELPENDTKKFLRDYDISIVIPIRVKNSIVAILILGSKLSGEIYESRDIDFLNIFASESGIAIQNAQSYEQIKRFNAVLEKKVEERTHQLKESQKRELAKAKDIAKLKDEFVFIASHELRTPVTAIKGFLEMVSEKTDGFPKDVKENLGYISEASNHLSQLINDLLEISRSDAGTMKVEAHPVNIKPIIESIIQEVTPQANKDAIKMDFQFAHDVGLASVDENKIKEVMMNILSNAIKYNHHGGYVDIKVFSKDQKIKIEVSDNGYGIPKDQQAKIFQKFFRASTERTGEVLGTGLGLFITRMLVEKMGGEITFTSVESKGTTFYITLPTAVKTISKIPSKSAIKIKPKKIPVQS